MNQPSATGQIPGMLRRAGTFQRAGQWHQAARLYQTVLDLEPANEKAMCGLAESAGRQGNAAEGIRLARLAVERHPRSSMSLAVLAQQLLIGGDLDSALRYCNDAIALDPENTEAFVTKSLCLERLNRLDEAMDLLRISLRYSPGDVYLNTLKARYLSRTKDYAAAREVLEDLVRNEGLYDSIARTAWNELGIAADKLGDYEAAYRAFSECGRLTARTSHALKCDRDSRYRMLALFKAGFTAERLKRFSPENIPGDEPAPAFLVGFPRSGTTLTEQIMAAHPGIVTSDEKPFIRYVGNHWARLVGETSDVGGMVDRTTDDHLRELRKRYWDRVEAVFGERYPDKLMVDKNPLNIYHLGLINMVFPDARVMVALRDPRDVCLSCFMQDFSLNNSMIHFLNVEGTGRFYAAVMDFYLHIRPMLTLRSIEFRYEDTVVDLGAQARRLLEHLGLAWSDEVLHFHEKARERYISTPSYRAVTEPVYKNAVQRWRNYEKHVEPILPSLERFIREFGYEF